jgi:hypothetical protein
MIESGEYSPKRPCTTAKKGFFENFEIYKGMASALQIDVNFIMALSVHESHWKGAHAQELHNLFGLTEAGHDNIEFKSYQESADFWVEHFGDTVRGKKTLGEFLSALLAIGYNSADPDWRTKIAGGVLTQGADKGKKTEGTYESVLKARDSCDIK